MAWFSRADVMTYVHAPLGLCVVENATRVVDRLGVTHHFVADDADGEPVEIEIGAGDVLMDDEREARCVHRGDAAQKDARRGYRYECAARRRARGTRRLARGPRRPHPGSRSYGRGACARASSHHPTRWRSCTRARGRRNEGPSVTERSSCTKRPPTNTSPASSLRGEAPCARCLPRPRGRPTLGECASENACRCGGRPSPRGHHLTGERRDRRKAQRAPLTRASRHSARSTEGDRGGWHPAGSARAESPFRSRCRADAGRGCRRCGGSGNRVSLGRS